MVETIDVRQVYVWGLALQAEPGVIGVEFALIDKKLKVQYPVLDVQGLEEGTQFRVGLLQEQLGIL